MELQFLGTGAGQPSKARNVSIDSPFKDAGYDVRDYKKVAPRYGTNDDLAALFAAAHERGCM